MRICVAAQQSIRMVSGGPRVQVEETVRGLRELGHRVDFFDQWSGIEKENYDLVHLFGANMMTHDLAIRLREFGIPFVVSSIFFTLRSPAQIRMTLRMEKMLGRLVSGVRTDYGITARVCRAANGVLPNTVQEGRLIEEGFGVSADRISVVPNGVDPRFADADPSLFVKRYGISDFILNVGHIGSVRKNVLSLVRALKGIDHPAVIIGKIQKNDYSERIMSEAATNRNIVIIDGLENDSPMLASAYAACRCFVLPSWFETPGIAALEAGLAGANIAITRYGGTTEYFRDHARYIEPGSISSIARAVEATLAAPKSEELVRLIRAEYLWSRVAAGTADAYRRLI